MNSECIDDYEDDDDPGFDTYVVNEENFVASCEELARQFGFPQRAIAKDTEENKVWREKKRAQIKQENAEAIAAAALKNKTDDKKEDSAVFNRSSLQKNKQEDRHSSESNLDEDDGRAVSILPKWIKFMPSNDEFYPAEYDKVIYDCYSLRVVFDREKTGFEETKDFPIVVNSIIAGRY